MRITPLDIRKQEFKKSMRGFDPDEVYAFLNTVAEEYEAALSDNKGLREHIVNLKERLDEFKGMEKNLRNTLLTAEKLTAEAKENAKREAGLILREAEVEAEKASENIRSHTRQLRREILELKKQKDNYITRLRTLIDNHREMISGFGDDFERADQEIENMESRIRDDSKSLNQNRRMNREKITEEFSRKPEEETDFSLGDVPIGAVEVDVEIEDHSKEDLTGKELRESVGEDIEHSLYPEIDEKDKKETLEEQTVQSDYSGGELADSASDNTGGDAGVNVEDEEKDKWTGYEVKKEKTDWKDYKISSMEPPKENEVEEALAGLTEGLESRAEDNSESKAPEARPVQEREEEAAGVYSGEEDAEGDFQDQRQNGTPEMKLENQNASGQVNDKMDENNPAVSQEETKPDNTWSMDRMRENLTNIGKQDG